EIAGRAFARDDIYQRASDDGGVGPLSDLAHVIGLGNAEAKRDRQVADRADAPHHLLRTLGERVASAGDTKARDRVQKAAAKLRGPAQSNVRRRGTEKEDCINPPSGEHGAEVAGLFDRQVENEYPVNASLT